MKKTTTYKTLLFSLAVLACWNEKVDCKFSQSDELKNFFLKKPEIRRSARLKKSQETILLSQKEDDSSEKSKEELKDQIEDSFSKEDSATASEKISASLLPEKEPEIEDESTNKKSLESNKRSKTAPSLSEESTEIEEESATKKSLESNKRSKTAPPLSEESTEIEESSVSSSSTKTSETKEEFIDSPSNEKNSPIEESEPDDPYKFIPTDVESNVLENSSVSETSGAGKGEGFGDLFEENLSEKKASEEIAAEQKSLIQGRESVSSTAEAVKSSISLLEKYFPETDKEKFDAALREIYAAEDLCRNAKTIMEKIESVKWQIKTYKTVYYEISWMLEKISSEIEQNICFKILDEEIFQRMKSTLEKIQREGGFSSRKKEQEYLNEINKSLKVMDSVREAFWAAKDRKTKQGKVIGAISSFNKVIERLKNYSPPNSGLFDNDWDELISSAIIANPEDVSPIFDVIYGPKSQNRTRIKDRNKKKNRL
ncbi:MAG: hypothetical protein LBO02_01130 [Holosporaceae bacterium]|nr:hypothetical protein [Holosporaceae bacterium]